MINFMPINHYRYAIDYFSHYGSQNGCPFSMTKNELNKMSKKYVY